MATGGYGKTRRDLFSSFTMNYLIRQYLQSKPGYQTMEHRALMHSIREFYNGALYDEKKLQLRRLLISRLQMNKQANQHAKILGLYRLPDIEQWTMAQTSKEYETTIFEAFFNRVAESRLFHIETDPDGKKSSYYRKPAQYMATAMALAAYSEGDVEAAIKKLWQMRKSNRLVDLITLEYMKSARYAELCWYKTAREVAAVT